MLLKDILLGFGFSCFHRKCLTARTINMIKRNAFSITTSNNKSLINTTKKFSDFSDCLSPDLSFSWAIFRLFCVACFLVSILSSSLANRDAKLTLLLLLEFCDWNWGTDWWKNRGCCWVNAGRSIRLAVPKCLNFCILFDFGCTGFCLQNGWQELVDFCLNYSTEHLGRTKNCQHGSIVLFDCRCISPRISQPKKF